MTELQFLLELLLNHKLPKGTKALIKDRIGVVENGLIPPPKFIAPAALAQAPSTQRLLDAPQAMTAPAAPVIPGRIVGGEINTGNGTKGPRKF